MEKNKMDYTSSLSAPLGEKLKMIPGVFGIHLGEKPEYQSLTVDRDKEIRRYGPMTLASVAMCGESYEEAKKAATICLMSYIFGKNRAKQSVLPLGVLLQQEVQCVMDSPVLTKQNLKRLMLSFVLPHKYNLSMAPLPIDKRIILHEKPGHIAGVIQYSGWNDTKKIEKEKAILIDWLNQNEIYHPTAELYSMEYDTPITLPFFRRNELHVEVLERY